MKLVVKGFKELKRSIKKLATEQKIATQQAINKTATSARSAGVKEIASQMGGAKQATVKKGTDLRKASKAHPAARIGVSEKAVGIEVLRKQTKVRKVRGKRAYRVSYKGRQVPGAFKIPELKGDGSRVIFRREGGKVKRVFGFITYQETERGGKASPVVKAMEKRSAERFPIEFDRALANRMRRAGL